METFYVTVAVTSNATVVEHHLSKNVSVNFYHPVLRQIMA